MYHRLEDEAGEFETERRPVPSALAMEAPGYQATFLRLIQSNQAASVVDLIAGAPGADWNFACDESGRSPLACLVSPDRSNLDQDAMVLIIDALVRAGASLTAAGGPSHPACQHDAAFIAASFGLDRVVRHLLDLGYPIDRESAATDNPATYFATLLHAAASCSALPTLELLVRRGIRCGTTDALGRTALHLALDVAPDLDTCLFLQQRAHLDPFQPDQAGHTPFAMAIAVLPDYAAAVLQTRSRRHKQLKDGAIWKYDFRDIIVDDLGGTVTFVDYTANDNDGDSNTLSRLPTPLYQLHPHPVRYTAIQLMVLHGQKQLLVQPIIKVALNQAWDRFAQRVWCRQLGHYIAFLVLFLSLSHLWPSVGKIRKGARLSPLLYPLAGVVALLALRLLYVELKRMWTGGRKIWSASPWNAIDIIVNALVALVVGCQLLVLTGFRAFWGPYWVNLAAVLHVVLALKLLRFACVPKETGALVAMVASLMKEIVRFLLFFLTFFLPFASAYYLLFKEGDTVGFRTVMVTLCRWLFGDIEFNVFTERLPRDNVHTGQVLFIFYMVVLGIALLNILVALITNTFNAVIENAEGEWILVFAKVIVEIMETSCSDRQLAVYHRSLLDKSGHPLFYEVSGAVGSNWVQVLRERMLHLNKQHRAMATKMNDIRDALDRLKAEEPGAQRARFGDL